MLQVRIPWAREEQPVTLAKDLKFEPSSAVGDTSERNPVTQFPYLHTGSTAACGRVSAGRDFEGSRQELSDRAEVNLRVPASSLRPAPRHVMALSLQFPGTKAVAKPFPSLLAALPLATFTACPGHSIFSPGVPWLEGLRGSLHLVTCLDRVTSDTTQIQTPGDWIEE